MVPKRRPLPADHPRRSIDLARPSRRRIPSSAARQSFHPMVEQSQPCWLRFVTEPARADVPSAANRRNPFRAASHGVPPNSTKTGSLELPDRATRGCAGWKSCGLSLTSLRRSHSMPGNLNSEAADHFVENFAAAVLCKSCCPELLRHCVKSEADSTPIDSDWRISRP